MCVKAKFLFRLNQCIAINFGCFTQTRKTRLKAMKKIKDVQSPLLLETRKLNRNKNFKRCDKRSSATKQSRIRALNKKILEDFSIPFKVTSLFRIDLSR